MRHFVRSLPPDFLEQNASRWNQQWANLKACNSGAVFQWYQYNGQPVNQLLSPVLSEQTNNHCSYCDAFPPRLADETIDHFKPKGDVRFLQLAYSWVNLFYACSHCQKAKMEQYSDDLISPDAPDYSFQRYFVYNFYKDIIEPNPDALETDQLAATNTIRIFQFNHPGQIILRRHANERWLSKSPMERAVDDFPFRFLFE